MSFAAVEQIARAVLYEGYLLYPYRATALKNRQRWMFGRLLPRDYSAQHEGSEPWSMQTECMVVGDLGTTITLNVRFLQLADAGVSAVAEFARIQTTGNSLSSGELSDPERHDNRETPAAIEREVNASVRLEQLVDGPQRSAFSFSGGLEGAVIITAVDVGERLFKLTVQIENLTPCAASIQRDLDQALLLSLISTHTILHVKAGEFVSLIDPPEQFATVAGTCRNIGTWPVLAGTEPGRLMLSSPIILSDDPQIAPESPGDLFDGTEIDEILTLRIQTLTDEEKTEIRRGGGQACSILERTEALSEVQLRKLHGRFQEQPQCPVQSLDGREQVILPGLRFQPGDQVRLRPRGRADAFDLLLTGKRATVVTVERDFEDRVHVGVVVDDDPGKDFGAQGLPGHRFFFSPEEVERV
jgi:hypothetical protein